MARVRLNIFFSTAARMCVLVHFGYTSSQTCSNRFSAGTWYLQCRWAAVLMQYTLFVGLYVSDRITSHYYIHQVGWVYFALIKSTSPDRSIRRRNPWRHTITGSSRDAWEFAICFVSSSGIEWVSVTANNNRGIFSLMATTGLLSWELCQRTTLPWRVTIWLAAQQKKVRRRTFWSDVLTRSSYTYWIRSFWWLMET
jgi:hypothetical protein